MRHVKSWAPALVVVATSALAWALMNPADPRAAQSAADASQEQTSRVFTPAHRSALDAVKDFFNRRPPPVQPIAYTHKAHVAKGMRCTDCHVGVERGPEARIPSVTLCMTCHQAIATDRLEIKKVAAYAARGEDIPWQRVYAYSPSAHVKFNHAPHIRTRVACATCHGDMTQQTVALRAVNMTMRYCVNCHKLKNASIDCLTCHF